MLLRCSEWLLAGYSVASMFRVVISLLCGCLVSMLCAPIAHAHCGDLYLMYVFSRAERLFNTLCNTSLKLLLSDVNRHLENVFKGQFTLQIDSFRRLNMLSRRGMSDK